MALALVSMLATHGCTLACASGVIANLSIESGLDPASAGRSGIGLAQWGGPRKRRLLIALGSRWTNARSQVAFIVTELREMGLAERLFRMTDPGEAAVLFAREYERPRSRIYTRRAQRAMAIYTTLVAQGAGR